MKKVMTEPVKCECGRWFAFRGKRSEEVYIQDPDFEYDALFTVSGDFGSTDIKLAYAQKIANALNKVMEVKP